MEDNKHWYQQFWPWFLMTPPAVAVVAGLITFYLAGGPPAMVVDDYGKIAMVTEQRAARDRIARELGLAARIEIIPHGDQGTADFRVKLSGNPTAASFPESLHLRLIHPTLPEMDADTVLLVSDGVYQGASRYVHSRMYIQISDPDKLWRLTGELPKSALIIELVANSVL